MPSFISEDDIEQALIAKLREKWSDTYNFESLNSFSRKLGVVIPMKECP